MPSDLRYSPWICTLFCCTVSHSSLRFECNVFVNLFLAFISITTKIASLASAALKGTSWRHSPQSLHHPDKEIEPYVYRRIWALIFIKIKINWLRKVQLNNVEASNTSITYNDKHLKQCNANCNLVHFFSTCPWRFLPPRRILFQKRPAGSSHT